MDKILILPPRSDACRVCAARHRPDEAHEIRSLYYKVTFYGRFGRLPTEEDAEKHFGDKK